MSEDNIRLVRQGYDAYERGDFAAIFALFHPDITIAQTDALPWGGTYQGHSQARDFFRKLNEHTAGHPHPEEFFAAGDQVIVIGRLQGVARATGHAYDLRIVHLWTVQEARITRFDAYIDTPAMWQALTREDAIPPQSQ